MNNMTQQGWPWDGAVNPDIYKERSEWPKISIVTPSYQQGQFIEETILSILNQNYPNLEYIIIDGGSTDNTVDIIKKYEDRITYWVSEPDKGQVDAINKGLEKCTGIIFNWINSDDYLEENTLFIIGKTFNKNNHPDLIAGNCVNFQSETREKLSIHTNSNLDIDSLINYKDDFHQPGLWIKMSIIQDYRFKLNSQYHYSFDRIWLYELQNQIIPSIFSINQTFAHFRVHESSKTYSEWYKAENELYQFLKTFKPQKKYLNKPLSKLIENLKFQTITRKKILNSKTNRINLIIQVIFIFAKNPKIIFNRFFLGALKLRILCL